MPSILWQSLVKESVFVSHTADTCPVIGLLILSLFPPLIFSIPHHLRELTCYKRESLITSATWLVSQCVWVGVCLFVLKVLGETVHVCNVHCVGLFFLLDVPKGWSSHSWSTFYVCNYRRNVEESVALGQTVSSLTGLVCVHVFGSSRCSTQYSKSDAFHKSVFFVWSEQPKI